MSDKKNTSADEPTFENFIEDASIDDVVSQDDDADDISEEIIEPSVPAKTKRGMGWGGGLMLALLASGAGAAGGWALSNFASPDKNVDLTPVMERVAKLETESRSQKAQLARLQTELSDLPIPTAGDVSDNNGLILEPLEIRVAELEDSFSTWVSRKATDTQAPEIDDLKPDVIDDVEAPSNDDEVEDISNKTATDITEPMTSETEAVDTSTLTDDVKSDPSINTAAQNNGDVVTKGDFAEALLALQADAQSELASNTSRQDTLQTDIAALKERLDTLEAELETTKGLAAAPVIVKEAVLLPPFPREAIFEEITRVDGENDKGWMSRTLKKHITVRDPGDVDMANKRLDEITALISDNDIQGALAKVKDLPPEGVTLAQSWIDAAQRQGQ